MGQILLGNCIVAHRTNTASHGRPLIDWIKPTVTTSSVVAVTRMTRQYSEDANLCHYLILGTVFQSEGHAGGTIS